jgi:hypothetical protein
MRRKRLVIAAAATFAAVVISGIVTRTRIVKAQSSAFTIKYVEKSGDWTRDSFYTRRSDGSNVESRVATAPDGKEYEQRTVIDTVSRVKVAIDGLTESITTYPLSQARVESYKKPASNCVSEEPSPSESTLLGYRIVRRSLTLPAERYQRVETWLASDLGCVILRSETFGHDSQGHEVSLASKEATSITRGDPDPTLFVIPNWQERSPSEVFAAYGAKFGTEAPAAAGRGLDAAYLAAQRHK